MKENRRDKFTRLATKRVNNALKCIDLVGNLSNKSNYDFTEKDIDKIFAVLSEELKRCRAKFNSTRTTNKKFELE